MDFIKQGASTGSVVLMGLQKSLQEINQEHSTYVSALLESDEIMYIGLLELLLVNDKHSN